MFVVCERFIFLLCGFFPQRFFRAGVWAHPAKLIMCLAPALCVSVCVCCSWMWLESVEVEVVCVGGCMCLYVVVVVCRRAQRR